MLMGGFSGMPYTYKSDVLKDSLLVGDICILNITGENKHSKNLQTFETGDHAIFSSQSEMTDNPTVQGLQDCRVGAIL